MSLRVRRLAVCAALLLGAAGCAQMEPPPGGPEDRTPPQVVVTRPDSLAVVPSWDSPVTFVFSERISEQRVEEAVTVSPRTSPVVIDRGSSSLRVSLRRGWEPGVIYHVHIHPEIQDLFNNRLAGPVALVFSTGPAIPETRLTGRVVDRISGTPNTEARVEAIRRADSLVYAARPDSAGNFTIARVPEGEYLIRAFPDPNRNRALDSYEARDSALRVLAVEDTAAVVRLAIVAPDSTPPRVTSTELSGERAVVVRFDDYLDPEQSLAPAAVQVTDASGVTVAVARVAVQPPTPAARDTTAASQPPLPSQTLMVELAEEAQLAPEQTYQIGVRGVRNVVGLTADVQAELTTPAEAPEAQQDPGQDAASPVPPPGR